MEREMVEKNLEVIRDAVTHHKEILIDMENQDVLHTVSKETWDGSDHRRRDRTKFVISKTIAFCPSVFEEDMGMKDAIMGISSELMTYFRDRQMTPLAELMEEYIKNEKSKDDLHFDYNYKEGS